MSQQQYAQQRLHAMLSRIQQAEKAAARAPGSVTLIGASKKQSGDLIEVFHQTGLEHVGENYVQEGVEKRTHISEKSQTGLCWHYIGHIQSNKTNLIAQHFSWVHGVDRAKTAKRLAQQNPHPTRIKLLVQLNLDHEASKSGVSVSQAPELVDEISQTLDNIGGAELKGFMAIPKARDNANEQRATFAQAFDTMANINQRYGLGLDQLSMGMSGDLESAIAEGATMVRVGTDLFGARE